MFEYGKASEKCKSDLLIALEHAKMAFIDWNKLAKQGIFKKIETKPNEACTKPNWNNHMKNPTTSFSLTMPIHLKKELLDEVQVNVVNLN